MSEKPGPRSLRELKIDFGKHILWVSLVKKGETDDHEYLIEGIDDEVFMEFAEKAREEQSATVQSICDMVQQILDATEAISHGAVLKSMSRGTVATAGDADERLSSASMHYFRQLVIEAPPSAVGLKQLLELIVEFGNGA